VQSWELKMWCWPLKLGQCIHVKHAQFSVNTQYLCLNILTCMLDHSIVCHASECMPLFKCPSSCPTVRNRHRQNLSITSMELTFCGNIGRENLLFEWPISVNARGNNILFGN
jgi:hypothetical protein